MKTSVEIIRSLAKSDYYQSLYSCAKELGLQLFVNKYDLTTGQLWLLSYLSMYSTIHMDILIGEVSDVVLKNEVYEDAYIYYKRKAGYKDKKEVSKLPSQEPMKPTSQWVFKRSK